MRETHRELGRLGGLQTYLRYGATYMSEIGRRGGRPSREEAARKAWKIYEANRRRAGRHGHQ